jgi:hypothetical protein
VIGSAGGPEKAAVLVDDFRFDAAIDHRADPVGEQLTAYASGGIDSQVVARSPTAAGALRRPRSIVLRTASAVFWPGVQSTTADTARYASSWARSDRSCARPPLPVQRGVHHLDQRPEPEALVEPGGTGVGRRHADRPMATAPTLQLRAHRAQQGRADAHAASLR